VKQRLDTTTVLRLGLVGSMFQLAATIAATGSGLLTAFFFTAAAAGVYSVIYIYTHNTQEDSE
jgi:hypothetical protein